MSGTLDTLSPEDQRAFDRMREDDAAAEAELGPVETAPPPPAAEPAAAAPETEAELADQPATVPHEALHSERERRKAAEKRERELERKHAADMARAQERLDLLIQAAQAQVPAAAPAAKATPDPVPDPSVDPLGYVQHVTKDLQQQFAELRQGVVQPIADTQRQQAEQAQAAQRVNELVQWGLGQEAEFMAEQPDYAAAVAHLRSVRERQYQARGVTNPAQVAALIQNDLIQEAHGARQLGRNFGRVLYDLAATTGYVAPAQSNGVVMPGQPAATPTPEQRIAAAQRGAQMGAGVGSAGSAPRGGLTVNQLANMSEAEFAATYAKMGGKAGMRQFLGE